MTDRTILISLENFLPDVEAQAIQCAMDSIAQWYENCCDCHKTKTIRATAQTKDDQAIPMSDAIKTIMGQYKDSKFIVLAAGSQGVAAFSGLRSVKVDNPFKAVLIKGNEQNIRCGFSAHVEWGIDLVGKDRIFGQMQAAGMMP